MRRPILDFIYWILDWLCLKKTEAPICLIGLSSLILLVLVGCQSARPPTGQNAIVQRVVSGQTLEVVVPSAQTPLIEQVRLVGISAPDLQQKPWGIEAKQYLEKRLGSRASVILESDKTEKDRYNRRLAYVWYDGKLLNETLVARGYALARGQFNPKYSQRLARAQEYARIMGYGIWNRVKPMRQTPDEFRATKPTPKSKVK